MNTKISSMVKVNKDGIVAVLCLLFTFHFSLSTFNCFAQTPNVIYTNYQTNLPNASWKFSFVHLTDIHVGGGSDDFGTPGWNDTLTGNDPDFAASDLQYAINWINAHADSLKIKFVMVTGDLSNGAERSEMSKCKQLLDSLIIPYFPIIGNHDIWPYTSSTEATKNIGDSLFNRLFASHFISLQNIFPGWDNGTRLVRTWNPEVNYYAYFQNYAFEYGSYMFMCCDFGTRTHAPFGNPGVGPDADLFNFTGGTLPWFKQKIINYPNMGHDNILIFSHFPLTKDPWAFESSFSQGEYNDLVDFLDPYKNNVGMWCAGHIHRDSEYGIKNFTLTSTICKGIETGSNKEHNFGHFRVIKMWDTLTVSTNIINTVNPLTSECNIFPNPSSGTFSIDFENAGDIEITDFTGKIVYKAAYEKKSKKIDLSSSPKGIYFVKINSKNTVVKKIIVL